MHYRALGATRQAELRAEDVFAGTGAHRMRNCRRRDLAPIPAG